MIEMVAEQGYEGVTVRGLSRLAGVSSGTLYEHFAGKEDCFFQTYSLLMARLARRVSLAYEGEHDRCQRVHLAFTAFTHQIAAEPRMARICFVEAFAVGPSALVQTQPAAEMFAAIVKDCLDTPHGPPVPPLLVKGIVAGLATVVRARLLTGRERELPTLAGHLSEWALCFGDTVIAEWARLGGARVSMGEIGDRGPEVVALPSERALGGERGLIASAAVKLAASEGYSELSVPRIRAAAGVSRKSFDAHFDGIDDCFLTALQLCARSVFGEAARLGADGSWAERVCLAISALCIHIARDPVRAWAVFVEIFSPGTDGVRHHAKLIDEVTGLVHCSTPDRGTPKLAAEASVGAVWGILEYHVASGRARLLPSMAAMLTALALAPSIGGDATVATIAGLQSAKSRG